MTEKSQALKDVIIFTMQSVQSEIERLDSDIKKLEEARDRIVRVGADVPEKIKVELEKKKGQYTKLINDSITIEDVLSKIQRIETNASLNDGQKEQQILAAVGPFFAEYENTYHGTSETVDVRKGESQFDRIMKETEVYGKLGEKVDELEKKAAILAAKRIAAGSKKPPKNPYELSKEDKVAYQIRDMKNKQCNEIGKQRLVMLSRQDTIDKRNEKISKVEAELKVAQANGESKKAERKKKKIIALKTKDVKTHSGTLMLLKERVVDIFTKTRYDADGNFDNRGWAERRNDTYEEKKGRNL